MDSRKTSRKLSGISTSGLLLLLVMNSCTYRFYSSGSDYPLPGSIRKVCFLPDSVNETSGLETSANMILTHNDSGGEPELYSIDRKGEMISSTVLINSKNLDWEDIARDDNYYYIADVGNNFGNRDTLTIYRFPVSEFETGSHHVKPEIIEFSFDEETTFSNTGWYSHDCEAMLAYGDSLYLFRKDWVNSETSIYVLPAKPGYYSLKGRAVYSVRALITGADILPEKKEVILVGYRQYMPVLISYAFEDSPVFIAKGGKARVYPCYFGTQVEGVCFDEDGSVLVSSEKSLRKQALYRVKVNGDR